MENNIVNTALNEINELAKHMTALVEGFGDLYKENADLKNAVAALTKERDAWKNRYEKLKKKADDLNRDE